jgi:hypothetical protein
MFGGILINSIKLMLSILALGMLIAVGCALDETGSPESAPYGGDHSGHNDFNYHGHNDWLNPGGYYSYSYWYPTYTYTYPTYYYTTPVVYPTYPYYYDPVVYDPWYGANIYGWGGASYYYFGDWSWPHHGGFYF